MVILIILLPLFAALISGVFSRTISNKFAELITSGMMVVCAFLSIYNFYEVAYLGNSYNLNLLKWIDSGTFTVSLSLLIDSLTSVMLVVVTVVSSLVHIYSIGYMSHDAHIPRFMSYLSLFTFFMLMLVTSNNFLQLFLGWEGVGLCSYLLIGFWYKKPSANAAAMKAFIVNRVGDFGFALGIFTIFVVFNTVQFSQVFSLAEIKSTELINILGYDLPALNVICILLFIGSMGKSAQIGLHTWLPDAMEGPTPVSALIHAATMVTAGVFLVARCSPLFEYAPYARDMVTIVGAITCVFAASIAITQTDIKKIIAYSTCSQLGYMFFACGVSAYNAGVFHLMTHAFFKALLFLGAGSVIHAMSGEQEIDKMGGIWKKLPFTYVMMWIGSLALAGFYPFAGYFSKDIILEASYASGTFIGRTAFYLGIVAAFCTAFYSWRLLIKTFHGKPNASNEIMHHVHESPISMALPLIILAIGAIGVGWFGSEILKMVDADLNFWKNAIFINPKNNVLEAAHHLPDLIKKLPFYAGASGVILAYIFYMFIPGLPKIFKTLLYPFYKLSLNKYYIDEIYDYIFVKPIKRMSLFLWNIIDTKVIDGIGPNGSARMSQYIGQIINRSQTGYMYHYAFVMLLALVLLISWYVIYNV